MGNGLRQVGMVLISTLLRWPFWGVLAASRFFVQWQTLFVVYPGDDSDVKGYGPERLMWLRTTWLFRGKPQFAGIQVRAGADPFRGVVVYISSTVNELRRDRYLAVTIMKRLEFIAWALGVRAIALAGQMPGVLRKHAIAIQSPFVEGRLGSSFSVIETVSHVCHKHTIQKTDKLVVVGVGFLGESVIEGLRNRGFSVQGIDIVKTRSGVRIGEDAQDILPLAALVVVLTPKGEDFIPYLKYIRQGAIIIDDTHPRIRSRLKGHTLYKVTLEWPGFRSLPSLPGYKRQWIPGCLVEAIVSCRHRGSLKTYEELLMGVNEAGIEVPLCK